MNVSFRRCVTKESIIKIAIKIRYKVNKNGQFFLQ